MIGRARAVTYRQTMANGFGHIGFGRLNGVDDGAATRQMGGDGRRIGATSAVCVPRLDKLAFVHVKESAVIEQIGGTFGDQMPTLDEHVLAAEAMNHFGCATCLRK